MKSALRYFIIIFYERKLVYHMITNTFSKNISNDRFCSRRVDTRGNSIYISIGETVVGKRQIPALKQPIGTKEKTGIFHYAY